MKKWLFSLLILLSLSVFASGVDVAFGPSDDTISLILNVINSAHHSICIAAYSFTARPIAQALVAAKERGIDVQIVADSKENSSRYALLRYLAKQGIDVHLNDKYAIMHDKFMVIDDETFETGSFNYSRAAIADNAENVLVMWNKPRIANMYELECNKLYAQGHTY